ncbi:MAG: hypothetical protein JWM85_384 [Acidimicrobiaceae bacterium]|nr:hypothetical protein [Acidimicrobiaceae bacterium]
MKTALDIAGLIGGFVALCALVRVAYRVARVAEAVLEEIVCLRDDFTVHTETPANEAHPRRHRAA